MEWGGSLFSTYSTRLRALEGCSQQGSDKRRYLCHFLFFNHHNSPQPVSLFSLPFLHNPMPLCLAALLFPCSFFSTCGISCSEFCFSPADFLAFSAFSLLSESEIERPQSWPGPTENKVPWAGDLWQALEKESGGMWLLCCGFLSCATWTQSPQTQVCRILVKYYQMISVKGKRK